MTDYAEYIFTPPYTTQVVTSSRDIARKIMVATDTRMCTKKSYDKETGFTEEYLWLSKEAYIEELNKAMDTCNIALCGGEGAPDSDAERERLSEEYEKMDIELDEILSGKREVQCI